MKLSICLSVSAFVAGALAHGGVLSYEIANPAAYVKGFVPYNSASGQSTMQREWDSYNPIQDPTLSSMACNAAGTAGALQQTIAAGSAITAYWNNPWPHTIGPMVVWMASCGSSCLSFEPTGAVWFKIQQTGLVSGTLPTGLWGSGQMVADNSSWTVTIPSTLKAGAYLIRHETMAIHTANAPQWYPECGQLLVTGSGTASPSSTYMASIPGVYSMSDPNVDIDVYSSANQDVTTYTIPGPAVWTG